MGYKEKHGVREQCYNLTLWDRILLISESSPRTQFFTQEYEGRDTDISLIPWQNHRSLTSAMLNLIHNPTVEEFTEWMKAAERETWRCVDVLSNICSKLIDIGPESLFILQSNS